MKSYKELEKNCHQLRIEQYHRIKPIEIDVTGLSGTQQIKLLRSYQEVGLWNVILFMRKIK